MPTFRTAALIVGITVLSAWVVQRVDLVDAGPSLGGSTSPGLVFPAIPLGVLGLLALLRRPVDRGERAVLYAALATGITVTGSGLMNRFLPGLVTGFYGGFASPTGPYLRFLKTVPGWMVPGGPNAPPAVGAFEGGPVPWSAWAVPLLCWLGFFFCFFLTSFSLVGLLRKRWIDVERLGFPLLDVPRMLLGGEGERGLLRSRAFWWGAAVPGVLFGVNGLHHYFPAVGAIHTGLDFSGFLLDPPWKAMAPFESPFIFIFSPILVGIAYLAPVEVSFSTWFFFLVSRAQLLVTELAGLSEYRGTFIPGHGSPWLDWPAHAPFFMPQARGGLFVLILASLWSARHALREAFHLRNPAVWGLLLGFGGLWFWVTAAGLPPLLGLGALLLFLLLSLAFVRLRIDGGLPVTSVPLIVGYLFFVVAGTGPSLFSDRTYTTFAFLAVLGYTTVGIWPALQFEGLKLAEVYGVRLRRMVFGMCLGLLVGLASGAVFSLRTVYDHGLFVLQEQGGASSEARIGRYYLYLMKDAGTVRGGTDWVRLGMHVLGAAFTGLLVVMRRRFLRWPFHPMGFIYGTGFGWVVWGSALAGWACKWLTVRYGGAATYRLVRPFFLGLIFGEICMRLLWGGVALAHGQMGMGYGMPFLTES